MKSKLRLNPAWAELGKRGLVLSGIPVKLNHQVSLLSRGGWVGGWVGGGVWGCVGEIQAKPFDWLGIVWFGLVGLG